jgi:hypothetical protein
VPSILVFGCTLCSYLASIQTLAPEDTLCSDLDVCRVGIDDHGRLPAQLEGDGREVLGGSPCHNAGYGPVSGVRDWVRKTADRR